MSRTQARRRARRVASKALAQLPPPARLRVREVKRAALGQPPVRKPKPARAPVPQPRPAAVDPYPPRPKVPGVARLDLRRDNIFATAQRGGTVLEIGPAHNAILPKRDGFATSNVDYLDRAGLVDKYKDFEQYSPDDIEEVDYVLEPGAAMAEVIGERFDLVLASHVLEHTTSLIDFVAECARLLKPGGVLALVVPDSRYCFDRFRERSSIGSVIDASGDDRHVHTVGTVTEFVLNAVRHGGTTAWVPGHRGKYSAVHPMTTVFGKAEQAARAESYIDVHHWVFTPHHLRLLLHDLADLGYVPLREAHFAGTVGHEFFLNLTAESAGSGLTRAELIDLADAELRSLDVPSWTPVEAG